MYVEDCDLCMRARKAGMILGDLENFSVIHNAQRTSRRRVDHFKWHIRSLLRYIICK
jgi:N-acetylglucosaminyl-diphospho-decaprenol L-rhamnosyltransferase